ncbi:histidine kinase N-terminal domain-containing protein [Chengkuizengella marina]|uniref:histidine kinase n=1 Tax=Chengkuizengella marina TaxID=2507566 RepID=A0A6N9Q7P7_9BACL|nr:histidine kinase N-terminal domain-containing protein [Chengkuizengella marina]NBI30872.1 GHKL domain-containing protein [Chengkuizengella marina]
MQEIRKQLICFLEKNSSTIIESWKQKAFISQTDVNEERVIKNGIKMYEVVKLKLEKSLSEEDVREFAYNVSTERTEAKINIEDFVQNVNVGRSEIINFVLNSGLPIGKYPNIIEEINTVFDQFTYFGIQKYTEIKEEQLQEKNELIDQTHKERLKILGQMSSSFVHEFRNPLTSLLGFTKLLNNEYPSLKYIDIIEHELHQLNSRVTQFLHVSKKEIVSSEMKSNSLHELFEDLISFIYPSIVDGNVTLTNKIEFDIRVFANKDELRQVFLNILLNSIDALQKVKHTRKIDISCNILDGKAEIIISNNGPVIPKEVTDAIFEPFYTTKDLGTGIGLYVCRNIIEKYNGEIRCVSDDSLTSFFIKIPI